MPIDLNAIAIANRTVAEYAEKAHALKLFLQKEFVNKRQGPHYTELLTFTAELDLIENSMVKLGLCNEDWGTPPPENPTCFHCKHLETPKDNPDAGLDELVCSVTGEHAEEGDEICNKYIYARPKTTAKKEVGT